MSTVALNARVTRHPHGGWTVAVCVEGSTVATYRGRWRSRGLAERALARAQEPVERAYDAKMAAAGDHSLEEPLRTEPEILAGSQETMNQIR